LLHPNNVPLVPDVTDAAGQPTGRSDARGSDTIGDTVSVTVRLVIVIVPVFVTTSRYVTGVPVPGEAGTCVFTIERLVTAG
jgi:hypothetical protein